MKRPLSCWDEENDEESYKMRETPPVSSRRGALMDKRGVAFATFCTVLTIVSVGILLYAALEKPSFEECICYDDEGNRHDFCYQLPSNRSVRGLPFNCTFSKYLNELNLSSAPHRFVLDVKRHKSVTFVTAFSEEHSAKGLNFIRSLRAIKETKSSNVVVYDIGLKNDTAQRLKSLCHVIYRRFDFEHYPPYFKDLQYFRWKLIIIAETARDFGLVFYADSSIYFREPAHFEQVVDLLLCNRTKRSGIYNGTYVPQGFFRSSNSRDHREEQYFSDFSPFNNAIHSQNVAECLKSRILLHSYSGHGIFATTDPELYKYFPVDIAELKKPKAKMFDAALISVSWDPESIKVLKWAVLCALEKECIITRKVNRCVFNSFDRFGSFAGCHRFDQSVFNVLLANSFYYDRKYYTSEITGYFSIDREFDEDIRDVFLKC